LSLSSNYFFGFITDINAGVIWLKSNFQNDEKKLHFYFLPLYIVYGESIVLVRIFEFELRLEISVLVPPESKKVVFRVMSVCQSVCVCVCVDVYKTREDTIGPILMKFGM